MQSIQIYLGTYPDFSVGIQTWVFPISRVPIRAFCFGYSGHPDMCHVVITHLQLSDNVLFAILIV
jgi:hypothetical protein